MRGLTICRRDKFVRVNTPRYEHRYLCAEIPDKRIIPFLGSTRLKQISEFGELTRYPGEEFLYVIEGCIEVHTEFYEPVVLGVGEHIYIDSNMGHAYLAGPGCEEAWFIAMASSANRDLMETLLGQEWSNA